MGNSTHINAVYRGWSLHYLVRMRGLTPSVFSMQGKPIPCITTDFRRAVRIYDWLKYGRKKTPKVPKGTEAD